DNAVNEFASSLNLLIPDLANWNWPTQGLVYYEPNENIRQRQRGVAISRSRSFLFAELILFGMDLYYIYQTTDIFLYRFHDDIWFFNSQSDKIEQAWSLMNEYAQISGLKFNKEKCGSIQIHPSVVASQVEISSTNLSLPDDDIRRGLLIRMTISYHKLKSPDTSLHHIHTCGE
ncbi:unnamed protein product, partial [Rotaria magnacalcarata]